MSAEYSFLTNWRVDGTIEEGLESLDLELRRRRATTDEKRRAIPAPPPPTFRR